MSEERKERRCWRRVPCPAYDVEGMESWLEAMAARGLFLTEAGFALGFGCFRRGEPGRLWYRLAAAPDGERREEPTLPEGWTHVADWGEFQVCRGSCPPEREGRRADDPVAAVQRELVRRNQRAAGICLALLPLLIGVRLWNRWTMTLWTLGAPACLAGLLLLLWAMSRLAAALCRLGRLQRYLAAPEGGIAPKPRHRRRAPAAAAAAALLLLLLLRPGGLLRREAAPLEEFTGAVPFATLAELGPPGRYELLNLGASGNRVQAGSSRLAPAAVSWRENASIYPAEGGSYFGVLYVDYYEVCAPWLARALAREVWAAESRAGDPLALPRMPVDFAAGSRSDSPLEGVYTVVLQRDNAVLRVLFFQGEESMALPLDTWLRELAESVWPA